ncbi:Zinc finger CCCH domain-containing protein 67 [Hirschfeldia incana]|nr:Zinc finger CCCH domain-containing protein 67 [Hirschfeldia incana]
MSKPDPDPKAPSGSSSEKDPTVVADDDHITEEELSEDLSRNVVLLDKEATTEELNVPISVSDGDQESERVERRMMMVYPVRPDAEDCSFYIRTGSCKYGSSCKFNHPLRRNPQIGREKVREREREEDMENPRLLECKYYFRTGGCKYGETCRFSHTKQQHTSLPSRPQLNFLGLPIRPGEKECPFYMRNGSCKFGGDCKFNHPDPTAVGGVDSPLFRGNNHGGSFAPKDAPQGSSTSWSSSRHMNGTGTGTGTAPFIPVMYSQNRGASSPQTPEWSGYQAPPSAYPPERNVFPPSTYSANKNPLAETSSFSQLSAEEFPERPDQPECSYYVKTGDCKFKFKCKYHHPKNRLPKQSPSSFNDKGLPLRPEQSMCTHYSRYGICKFGPACRFDHSIPPTFSSSSSQTVETPQLGGNGNENDSWN